MIQINAKTAGSEKSAPERFARTYLRNTLMNSTRRTLLALGVAVIPALWLSPALAADTAIAVSLWDSGDKAMEMLGKLAPMGMAMTPGADMKMATMGITLDQATVPAGNVTFNVSNDSKSEIHEMVVAPVADPMKPLPYNKDLMKVDEDGAGHLGEVAELEPGQSGALTLDLKPGTYILYCNIPGHYELGMWTLLTVSQ
jgi:uncharacterized cupredoxin-like copper-binding protein